MSVGGRGGISIEEIEEMRLTGTKLLEGRGDQAEDEEFRKTNKQGAKGEKRKDRKNQHGRKRVGREESKTVWVCVIWEAMDQQPEGPLNNYAARTRWHWDDAQGRSGGGAR